MKKNFFAKLNMLLCIALLCGSLNGCANQIPEMSDDEQAAVCEYAAGLLLKYDKYYSDNILSEEDILNETATLEAAAELKQQIEAEKEAREAAEISANQAADNSDGTGSGSIAETKYQDIDEFLGLDGLDIEYAGYEVYDRYPDSVSVNDWQGVCNAGQGNKLVVFQFDLINNSGEDYYLDMASMDVRFTFKINEIISKAALTTLLSDDLLMYRGVIPYENSVRAVIVIEMSENDALSISSVLMKMKYEDVIKETTLVE